MVLYTQQAWKSRFDKEQDLRDHINVAYAWSSVAMERSGISLEFDIVLVERVSTGWGEAG